MFFKSVPVPNAKSIRKPHKSLGFQYFNIIPWWSDCCHWYIRPWGWLHLTIWLWFDVPNAKNICPPAWGKSSSTTPRQGVADDFFHVGCALQAWAEARHPDGERGRAKPPAEHLGGRLPSRQPNPTPHSLAQRGNDQNHRRRIGPFPVATVGDEYENHIRIEVKAFQTNVHHVQLNLDKCLKLGCTCSTNTQKVAWLTLSST